MTKKYLSLLGLIWMLLSAGLLFSQGDGAPMPLAQDSLSKHDPIESMLAFELPVPFMMLDLYQIELLPGVSEKFGKILLNGREQIIETAADLPPERKYKAFKIAKGIGEKTAKKLEKLLTLPESSAQFQSSDPSQ